jgi:hypothetical protein
MKHRKKMKLNQRKYWRKIPSGGRGKKQRKKMKLNQRMD